MYGHVNASKQFLLTYHYVFYFLFFWSDFSMIYIENYGKMVQSYELCLKFKQGNKIIK